ncbi:hypothetical protein [Sorangium sp. So ce542]|uniref:hypothetical protein n=1 Tax=Sorangium sp. So ce542 TaxID=3133316 RepID=UPI003F5DF592
MGGTIAGVPMIVGPIMGFVLLTLEDKRAPARGVLPAPQTGQPLEERFERDLRLRARQQRADAEVDALAEGEVLARVPAVDVEALAVGELRLVPVP